ncbi:sporulation initiation phosphotransferase B [Fictibacillus nanhaiensis]|uniref:Spo0B domain-containing protein n=1 Tax=Fictibacillus nanhaiensis TaxID=742169 RepID=UPI001C988C09|nr:Spo0B domain-containing protein [Fictibacillus nanhaiensis]MBY6035325.1 sporulation initiation phosphotransferase B [Fictibacillus nanhaiensis]
MSKKWTTVDLLRHARHDWLNQLQLIKANLSLDRTERAKEIMNEVIELSREESRISNLKTPNLSEYLLTYNWLKHPVKLFAKVKGESGDFSLYEEELLHTIDELCDVFNNSISGYEESSLTVTFKPEDLHVSFTFVGVLSNQEQTLENVKKMISTHKSMILIESYIQDNKCYFEIQLTS